MNDYKRIITTLGSKFGMIEMALSFGNKKDADKIWKESLEWLEKTYDIKRKEGV